MQHLLEAICGVWTDVVASGSVLSLGLSCCVSGAVCLPAAAGLGTARGAQGILLVLGNSKKNITVNQSSSLSSAWGNASCSWV